MGSSMGSDIAHVSTTGISSSKATIDPTAGEDFVDNTSLKQLLRISDATMNQAMGIAYQLYVSRRLVEAEIVCRGVIACDHRYWWSHSLHASVLRRLGRLEEALQAVEQGLKYAPAHPKLVLMHAELLAAIDRRSSQPQPSRPDPPAEGPGIPNDHASIAAGTVRPANGAPT